MPKLARAVLAVGAIVTCGWSSLDADSNNPERFQTYSPTGRYGTYSDEPTRIERSGDGWISHGPTGTYGCSYIHATNSVQCPQ